MIAKKLTLLVLTLLVILNSVKSDTKVPRITTRSDFKRSLAKDCANSYSFTCLKLDMVSWVDKLNEADNYDVIPGLSVVRENNSEPVNTAEVVAELARDFPNDSEARLDNFLMKTVSNYLNNHSLKLKLLDNEDVVTGRGKGIFGKKGGGLGLILALGAMMKSTFGALALSGIAAIAGKALMMGLMALMLSTIVGLRSYGGGGGAGAKSITVYDDHGRNDVYRGGYSGYERNYEVPVGVHPTYQPHY